MRAKHGERAGPRGAAEGAAGRADRQRNRQIEREKEKGEGGGGVAAGLTFLLRDRRSRVTVPNCPKYSRSCGSQRPRGRCPTYTTPGCSGSCGHSRRQHRHRHSPIRPGQARPGQARPPPTSPHLTSPTRPHRAAEPPHLLLRPPLAPPPRLARAAPRPRLQREEGGDGRSPGPSRRHLGRLSTAAGSAPPPHPFPPRRCACAARGRR